MNQELNETLECPMCKKHSPIRKSSISGAYGNQIYVYFFECDTDFCKFSPRISFQKRALITLIKLFQIKYGDE